MDFDYICHAVTEEGEPVQVDIVAPSQYAAKRIARRHCDQWDLEFKSVELNPDQ